MNEERKLIEITNRIFIFKDQKVMLDRDLAELYGVELKALNQAVKRNQERFPCDFMFQLDFNDLDTPWSQIVTMHDLSARNYMKRNKPFAFTEAGSFALSFVLNSEKAIDMGQFIIRAFTHLRRFVLKNENLMMELKNNDHLSKTFSNFEKRIEQDLIVLYKNNSAKDKRLNSVEEKIKQIEIELKNIKK
ncbi:MAG: ORF6N domain-containing protein [Bacteriovorax sp.]|nr:ORF6N domain-containing protein [Bacteriovorax sp.]